MKILVTGSAGQLGSYLVEHLAREHEVVGMDIKTSGIPEVDEWTVQCDIRSARDVDGMMTRTEFDAVIHAAAQVSVKKSLEDPSFDAATNIIGTINLLRAAKAHDVGKFVYISSAAVYGNPEKTPIAEDHPTGPLSPYGISKLSAEQYCLSYHRNFDLEAVIVRPFNFYSRRQDPDSPYSGVISKFIEAVKKGQAPKIEGDGSQTRDFVSVKDCVRMIDLILNRGEGIGGCVFNCATGIPTSINELAERIMALGNLQGKAVHVEPRVGDIRESFADISKARDLLGFEPSVPIEDGLRELF